ncbi:alpha-amylase family protein [Actinopolymorpha sp. NPDC004070]|uniref:alpha-amylase family protein n=1 Tax=Actinopolymorpha sp. NPDC004070 TaxID=3154548 RepID=UPI0033B94CF7
MTSARQEPARKDPWYRRTVRWGQTNLTEKDPVRYDAQWWREYWRRTRVQGVIVNAGGIVAYYPSAHRLQHRAAFLGDGDLYGEVVRAAREEEGLTVLARMDSNRAAEDFYLEHPDWFAVDADGRPYRAGDLYVACVNGPYYQSYLPSVLEEIIARSAPDGITDNSWSGLDRDHICYCDSCRGAFGRDVDLDLPASVDWADPAYRRWVEWSYRQRLAVWDLNNEVTTRAGGPDCLWIGMNGGDLVSQSLRFRDHKAICERTPILMLDSQFRHERSGFQANGDSGKVLHGLLGWDALIPESTAMYDAGTPTFRLGSKPEPEARMWAVEGFAAGIQPWWHHIGSVHEDRRQFATAPRLFGWHERHQDVLLDRTPIATVGVVWSQRSIDFHGRDDAESRSMLPYRGFVDALIRARIPYLPVHADHIGRDAANLAALVVPNVGVLTEAQCGAIRAYAEAGGGLVVSGESGGYDEWGGRRPDHGLADLLGVLPTWSHHGDSGTSPANWETYGAHTYLRLDRGTPECADLTTGLEETETLPFGGRLEVVRPEPGVNVALTWVPPFPIYPPEKSWMSTPRTDLPAVVTRSGANGRRAVYLAADVDRCYARHHHPDHGKLLANVVRWAAHGEVPLAVEGAGVLDCHLYRKGASLVLHLVNLDQGGAWRGRLQELTPSGPFEVRVRPPAGVSPTRAEFLVSEGDSELGLDDGWVTFGVERIADHEVVVLS